MTLAEIRNQIPHSLEYWIALVENNWKNIPEYKVDEERFRHLAIICDGNRRAAIKKGLNPWYGHRVGLEVIRGVIEAGRIWGIRHLTFWTWSTENWKRDEKQIGYVMGLATKYLRDEEATKKLFEYRVKFTHFGRKDRLASDVLSAINDLEERTALFSDYYLNLALDYGGLDEAGRAVARMMEEGIGGRLLPKEVADNPQKILEFLDTKGQPQPDLVIRTGAQEEEVLHTSGFMPFQSAYSGWAFVPDFFPDLTPQHLLGEIQKFTDYERRIGR